MRVLLLLDAVLEPTKEAILETRKMLDEAGITEQFAALCSASGHAFYNTSKFTLRDFKSRGNQQQFLADFEDYLNGLSSNVQDILENFKFRNQLTTLSKVDALGTLIAKFLDPETGPYQFLAHFTTITLLITTSKDIACYILLLQPQPPHSHCRQNLPVYSNLA
jgi:type I restriction-modification system DNA methylase subunit